MWWRDRRRVTDALEPVTRRTYTPMTLDQATPSTRIDRFGALLSSDFIACETAKTRAIRSLPVHVVHRVDNGREPTDDHPMARLLHRPNALMSWGELMEWAVLTRDILGTAYIRVRRDRLGGVPTALLPVLATVSTAYDRETGQVAYSAGPDTFSGPWTATEADVIVLKTDVSTDGGITGDSLVRMAAEDIGLSVDLPRFYRNVLQNGDQKGGWLSTDQPLSPEDVAAIHESLEMQKGMDGAGETRVYDRGLQYHQVSIALADLDLIDQERWVLSRVCRVCHVDLHHVYADEGSTATTATGADIDFVKNTVLPEITAIEDAMQPALDGAVMLGGGADSGYRVKFDTAGLLRGDFKTRMDGYRIAVYSGIWTRARCCELEDVPWLPGQDRLLQPTAYYMLDPDGVPYLPAAATEGTSGQSDGVSGTDERVMGDRLTPVISDALDRVTRRAATDGDSPRTREYARSIIAPVAQTAALCGLLMDVDAEIDEAIEKGISHA